MIRFLRRLLGHESMHADRDRRNQRTDEMLMKLSDRQRNVERQIRQIRQNGDWFESIFYPRPPHHDHEKGSQE